MATNSNLAQKNERSGRNVCAECGAELPLDDVKADLLAALQWAAEWLRDWRSKYNDSTLPAWVRWHDEMVKPAIAKAEGREVAP